MTIFTTGSDRAALIQGLIDLAAFIETHPDVPIGSYEGITASLDLMVFPQGTMSERCHDVDAIAALIGEAAVTPPRLHNYVTERHFGPVTYKAVAVPPSVDGVSSPPVARAA